MSASYLAPTGPGTLGLAPAERDRGTWAFDEIWPRQPTSVDTVACATTTDMPERERELAGLDGERARAQLVGAEAGVRRRRLRKIGPYLGFGLIGLVVLYLILWAIAGIIAGPRDDLAFFEARPGEHQPLVFAHQGGEAIRPANTMVAFRHSAGLGADVLDADMRLSSDGVPVLIHDETVDGTSNRAGQVRSMTLSELRELDFGYAFSTDDGSTFPYRGQGHGIVTVDELFSEFTDMRFGIEIKRGAAEAAFALCDLINDFGYEDRVLVSTSDQGDMDAFRDACPDVATSATTGEARRFYIFQFVRLSGFYSPPFDSLQVPEYRGGTHVLTETFVRAANRWNIPVVPWTINEVEDFDRLITDHALHGINTDHPDRLIDYLEES